MKVLIVAKTRHGSGACIGGITLDEGRSVRLIAADAAFNEHVGLEYNVGEVWEVDATPAEHVIPPHVENIIVRSKCRLAAMSAPEQFIETHMPPVHRRHEPALCRTDPGRPHRRPLHRRAHRHPTLQHDLLAARSTAPNDR